ncbi:endonuclease domain-containing 1 protein [Scleropages formosus]|uniref:Endonuclease domain-containing 1 protein-like n=1 Tax=Scleropages formosus TaxID=113540 RepID=A0A8C9RYX7_SCLFO|nr:endonuclease domain-containing 1 protein-like [Scleropages formosus]XP_029111962.1 endonuclease domain-containing 1 protein-like [Scleropages formosus]
MELLHSICLVQLLSALALTEVTRFTKCPQFFAKSGKTPTIFQGSHYKQICQRLNNQYKYATLYDTKKRIPVYSAYKYVATKNCTRRTTWDIEPQLDDSTAGAEMGPESRVDRNVRGLNQALNNDYDGSGFDRGYLYPVLQNDDQCYVNATFTLTNAAPQDLSFNRGKWKKIERKIIETLTQYCRGIDSYIVTGVVPGNNFINGNRVNIPSYFWSAYCCFDNNQKAIRRGGYINCNVKDTTDPKEISVRELESNLTNNYRVTFSVFGGECL